MPSGSASSSSGLARVQTPPPTAASAAEPSHKLLLDIAQLREFQQTAHRSKQADSSSLQVDARNFLNAKIEAFSSHQIGAVQSHPVDTYEWETWREYIAILPEAEKIIGTKGIIAICVEQIAGVQDPNRGGNRRVDIVVYNADGLFFQIHPGGKRKGDAQLKVGNWLATGASEPNAESSGAAEPGVTKTGAIESASRQYCEPPRVLTQEAAGKTPQNHRMGRDLMFRKLQSLPKEYPLELTHTTVEVFAWWLWIPNTGTVRDRVIGNGIERIALMETTTDKDAAAITWARFLIVQTNKQALLLDASQGSGRGPSYSIQFLDASNYDWWVKWGAPESSTSR